MAFVNIKAFVVEQQQLLTRERDWVVALSMSAARHSWTKVHKVINAAEKREQRRRRRGPPRRTHADTYMKYNVKRERATYKNYVHEDLLVAEGVNALTRNTFSGVFPGTSFQMKFRF